MLDFSAKMGGCVIFSKVDLRKGYHQIAVNADDIPKTAISTPFGLFEYLRMPFGLRNAGNTFQRHMDRVLAGLDGVYCYLDDIIVASEEPLQHEDHLRRLFLRLREHGLVINGEKCVFGVKSLEFLGHTVSAAGAAPVPSYVEAVNTFPRPTTIKELQQFLGLVNFYRRFLPGVAGTLRPLTDALKGHNKGADKLQWTAARQGSFQQAKSALSSAVRLSHPRRNAIISLAVDASATHIGACLQQKSPGTAVWEPLGFYSKKLDAAQLKYSAFDRELLACYLGIRHFRFMLEGRQFVVYTDHKPLTSALHRTSDPWTARQCRQLAYVAEYTSDVRHISGKNNVVADALSRPPPAEGGDSEPSPPTPPPIPTVPAMAAVAAVAQPPPLPFSVEQLASFQHSCPAVQSMMSSKALKLEKCRWAGCDIWCDTSSGNRRPLLPVALREKVFHSVHDLAHPGIRASRRLVSSRYVWKGLAADVRRWCQECQACQRGKITTQPAAPVVPIPIPSLRFSHLHMDIVGPLPVSSEGFRYVLTIIDRSTRWLEVFPLKDIEAASIADCFIRQWVPRFGIPAKITTDRGTQFTASTWASLCVKLGIDHILTTAYHPQANGMVERSHRQLKNSLRARLAANDWPDHLPWVLLGLHAAPKEDSAVSSAELVFGVKLALPGEFNATAESSPAEFVKRLHSSPFSPPATRPLTYAQAAAAPSAALMTADFVYIRKGGSAPPLSPLYVGPYRVISREAKFFQVQIGGKIDSVSVDRLKPHKGSALIVPATAPLRGRPPRTTAAVPAGSAVAEVASSLGGAHVAA
jgi:cleavage and polyadenylation specificity factor subunit 1